ncbi:MAG: PEP-CTERM sorting domain-containing protein [Thiobacillus sp.]|nr:PEP-CTERM sorting domain-containing protein [Thiobacillus sp.]
MKTNTANNVSRLIAILLGGLALSSPTWATSYTFTELKSLSGGFGSTASAINNLGQVIGTTHFDSSCWQCPGSSTVTIWNGTTEGPLGLGGSARYNYGNDINDVGQVVGYGVQAYTTSENAFVRTSAPGTLTYLSSSYYYDSASAINNRGQVAGSGADHLSTGRYGAFVWDTATGVVTHLGQGSIAVDINDAGQVVGKIGSNVVVWNGTTATVLGTLSGGESEAKAINNAGQVVGYSKAQNGYGHATLWNNTTAIDLGSLGGHSQAMGINNAGQVVGTSYTAADAAVSRAFFWDGTTMTDLNSFLDASTVGVGWVLNSAQDINDNGQIIGSARNTFTGQFSVFLLTPVPEPETYAMMLAGLCVVGVAKRRKQSQSN